MGNHLDKTKTKLTLSDLINFLTSEPFAGHERKCQDTCIAFSGLLNFLERDVKQSGEKKIKQRAHEVNP